MTPLILLVSLAGARADRDDVDQPAVERRVPTRADLGDQREIASRRRHEYAIGDSCRTVELLEIGQSRGDMHLMR